MTERDLAAELQATKNDEAEWGDPTPKPPPKSSKRRLAAMVSVRLSPEELELVQLKAEKNHQSVSAYIRALALNDASGQASHSVTPYWAGVSVSAAKSIRTHVDNPGVMFDGCRLQTAGTSAT